MRYTSSKKEVVSNEYTSGNKAGYAGSIDNYLL